MITVQHVSVLERHVEQLFRVEAVSDQCNAWTPSNPPEPGAHAER